MKKLKFFLISLAIILSISLSSCVAKISEIADDLVEQITTGDSTGNVKTSNQSTTTEQVKEEKEIAKYESDYTTLYGYNQLKYENYSSILIDVYEKFYEASSDFLNSDEDYEIQTESGYSYVVVDKYIVSSRYIDVVASAWITFIEENPIYYFLYTGYTADEISRGKYAFYLLADATYATAEARAEANALIIEMINDFNLELAAIETEMTDYDKAKLIHDFICNRIDYAYDEDGDASSEIWAHNIIGVASKLGAVCESYAETYLFLSRLVNLESLIVLGYSGQTGHAWNYTCIDGVWYGVDATWDDEKEINYNYFLVSSRIMNKEHSANSNYYFGIDYQVSLPTLSQSSYDTSLDQEEFIIPTRPTRPGRNPWFHF